MTHVVSWARGFPRRADTAATVTTALLSAAGGLGHRRVAEVVDRPATTVRGWLRRARANSDLVAIDATAFALRLDPNLDLRCSKPTGSALGDMLEAVGLALRAWVTRFGPVEDEWPRVVQLTAGAVLAPRPGPRLHRRA